MPVYNTPQRPQTRDDGWPTRGDIRYDTDAERLCRILVGIVEGMGAGVSLTRAVTLLAQARDAIADHVERIEPPTAIPTAPEPCPHGWTRPHCGSCSPDLPTGPGPATPTEPPEHAQVNIRQQAITAAAEAMEDAAMRWLGRDLGTIHRDDIAAEALAAALPALLNDIADRIEWAAQDSIGDPRSNGMIDAADLVRAAVAESAQ